MLTFALIKFNQNLLAKNACYTLDDDLETLVDNYTLRVAKKNGMIEPKITEDMIYNDNVKALEVQRFVVSCFSNAFKASLNS